MTRPPSPMRLWYCGDVDIVGRPVFRMRFNLRSNGPFPPDPVDGVSDLETVEDFKEALISAYPRLTGTEFGWRPWPDARPREVAIRDVGPSRHGLAAFEGRESPYMVLSPAAFESTRKAERRRRRTTVVHELVHLLQFESPLFRFWYERRKPRHSDPNWWLHEAAALSTECLIYPDHAPSYPRLWQWATRPELSLESDADGYLAMPFVLYLQHRFGPTIVARFYDTTPEQVESMRGAEIMEWELRRHNLALVGESSEAGSVFLDYCVDAALLGVETTLLDPAITQIVGTRAISDAFRAYPVFHAGDAMPIDHLGCRYFEFYPPELGGQSQLSIEVSVRAEKNSDKGAAANALQGELVLLNRDDLAAARQSLDRLPNGHLRGVVSGFSSENTQRVLLVLANGAFGPGWAYHDDLQFTIRAQTA